MKTKLFLLLFFLGIININAQEHSCRAKEENELIYRKNPNSFKEKTAFDAFSKKFAKEYNKSVANKALNATYTIPVVFHVYGNTQNGKTVTYDKIVTALQKLNEDYNGLNPDYNTVEPFFQARRSTLNIEFKLAKIDPNGGCTTGVVFHNAKNGYGNGGGYDDQIQADAWDNYKYMNIYIQSDLYNSGSTTSSGVAWYPDSWMSDNNLARVVYNGAYLHDNTNAEFASVLTHEFGHFLNLIHTFDGECNGTDEVDDTPAEDGMHGLSCTPGTNCTGDKVNIENYMGYNGASGCYKMYTLGQTTRMLAALQHPARVSLWQPANLIATGVNSSGSSLTANSNSFKEAVVNNGSFDTSSVINSNGSTFTLSSGTLVNGTHFTHTFPAGITPVLTVNSNVQLTLTLNGNAANHLEANNSTGTISFLPAAFTGGTTGFVCTSLNFSCKFTDPYGIFFVDMADAGVTPTTTWKYFAISKGDVPAYGVWHFAANHLKLETYGKKLVCNPGTRNMTKLGFNVPVNAASNMTAPGAYPGQLDIRTSTYNSWDGQSGYLGFEYTIDGLPCYGWFKATVNPTGSGYTITEYAYNTEPYGTIYTGMTPKVAMSVSPTTLNEAVANNGSFTAGSTIVLATNNGTFTQSTGTFTAGTHYTISGVPAGLTPVLTVQSNTEAKLTFSGNAPQHVSVNNTALSVTFLNPAITGGTVVLESEVFDVNLKFDDPYGIYFVDIDDYTVDAANTWKSFQLEADADDKYYGAFVDAASQNALKLETYQKPVICNGTTKNITLLGNNEPVNATRNMVVGGAYPDLHVLRNQAYTVWDGQTGFIGFEYYRAGNPCYGWFRVVVSADGSNYTVTDYAYNTEPYGTIYTPNPLSINDPDTNQDVALSPNPFESQLTIDTSKLAGNAEITITNILGQGVYKKYFEIENSNIIIDTEFLNKGLYIIKIKVNKEKVITKKIIRK